MNLSTKDKLVLVILTAVFFYTGYLFFFNSSVHHLNSNEAAIGKIVSGTKSVRRKSQDWYVWEEITAPEKLFSADLVYTGDNASAKLEIADGVILDLGEKTLVKLSEMNTDNETMIIQGKAIATVVGKKEFKLKVKNQVVTISPKSMRSTLEIDASKSEVTVKQIEGDAQIEKKEVAAAPEEAPRDVVPPNEVPAEVTPTPEPTPEPVAPPSLGPKAEPIQPPEKLKAPKLPKNQNFEIKLNQILPILKNSRMPASEDDEFYVDLSWPEVEGAKSYWLEIYAAATDTAPILKQQVDDNKWRWDNPQLGKFYWKIAGVDDSGIVGEYSTLESINVRFNFQKYFVIKDFTSSVHRRPRISEDPIVKWNWQKVPLATSYKIRLSYTRDFKRVFFEKEITENLFSWDASEFSVANADRPVFMDLVANYKGRYQSPAASDRFIVIIKGSYLIKKQIDSSYVVFNYAPSKSTYKISSATVTGESDHTIPVSVQLNAGFLLNSESFIYSGVEYKSTTFFSDSFSPGIDYQDLGLEVHYGRSLYNWRQFGFALSLGYRMNRLTEISATSATALSGVEKTFSAGIVNAFLDQVLNDRWAHYAKVGFGMGNLTIINLEYNLKHTLMRSIFANTGVKYIYKDTAGTTGVSITDQQIFLGVGWELPF